MARERIAGLGEVGVVRQHDGQLVRSATKRAPARPAVKVAAGRQRDSISARRAGRGFQRPVDHAAAIAVCA